MVELHRTETNEKSEPTTYVAWRKVYVLTGIYLFTGGVDAWLVGGWSGQGGGGRIWSEGSGWGRGVWSGGGLLLEEGGGWCGQSKGWCGEGRGVGALSEHPPPPRPSRHPPPFWIRPDTVNRRSVYILLECILVFEVYAIGVTPFVGGVTFMFTGWNY